jgi:hypothetical protein
MLTSLPAALRCAKSAATRFRVINLRVNVAGRAVSRQRLSKHVPAATIEVVGNRVFYSVCAKGL